MYMHHNLTVLYSLNTKLVQNVSDEALQAFYYFLSLFQIFSSASHHYLPSIYNLEQFLPKFDLVITIKILYFFFFLVIVKSDETFHVSTRKAIHGYQTRHFAICPYKMLLTPVCLKNLQANCLSFRFLMEKQFWILNLFSFSETQYKSSHTQVLMYWPKKFQYVSSRVQKFPAWPTF